MGTGGALSPIYLIYNNPFPIREGRLSPTLEILCPYSNKGEEGRLCPPRFKNVPLGLRGVGKCVLIEER